MATINDWPRTLRAAREGAGLSQQALADRLSRTQGWVTKVETGRQGIRVEDAQEWARACGQDLQMGGMATGTGGIDDEGRWLVQQLVAALRAGLPPQHRLTLRLQLEGWPIGEEDPAVRLRRELNDLLKRHGQAPE